MFTLTCGCGFDKNHTARLMFDKRTTQLSGEKDQHTLVPGNGSFYEFIV